MSKYCPIIRAKVTYLECQECTERACRNIGAADKDSYVPDMCKNCRNLIVKAGQTERGSCSELSGFWNCANTICPYYQTQLLN